MAELTIFHYIPNKSIIHYLDGRFKLTCMILFTIAVGITGRFFSLSILSSILVTALVCCGLPIKRIFIEIRYFLFLIGIVIIAHSLSVPGRPIASLPIPGLTWEGLSSGLFFGWRLILIFILNVILTGTTSLSSLRDVIQWFLRPLPLINGAKVATMFSLTFALLPLIFDELSEIREAQKARCIENRKNPIHRISSLVFPLLLGVFLRADQMALAMESRCYSDVRARAVFKATFNDWLFLIFSAFVCAMVLYYSR